MIFSNSSRVQQAYSKFYAIVVRFCSKTLKVYKENGKHSIIRNHLVAILSALKPIGTKRAFKSFRKPFEIEFKEIKSCLNIAKNDIEEELA